MGQPTRSGAFTAAAVSVASLALVWGLVWANLPSKEELLSETAPPRRAAAAPPPAELDLTIPGVPSSSAPAGRPIEAGPSRPAVDRAADGAAARSESAQARQIMEIKCEAEMQRLCPDAAAGDAHRRCVEMRVDQIAPACQDTVRRRVVKWKSAVDYRTACQEDINRSCRHIQQPGDEGLLQCLQDHAQSVTDQCYQTLPKGKLLYQR